MSTVNVCPSSWITHVKFSPPVQIQSNEFVIYIAAASSGNSVYLLTVRISKQDRQYIVTIDNPILLNETVLLSVTYIDWFKRDSDDRIVAIFAMPRNVFFAEVTEGLKTYKLVSVRTDLFTPIIGAGFEMINNDNSILQVELISETAQTVIINYNFKNSAAMIAEDDQHSNSVSQHIMLKSRTYSSSMFSDSGVSSTEMRIHGVGSDFVGNSTFLYTISPTDRLRYPITSTQSSQIAFVSNLDLKRFWEAVETQFENGVGFSPRSILWAAKLSIFQTTISLEEEVRWVTESIDLILQKLDMISMNSVHLLSSEINELSFFAFCSPAISWRRVLYTLYSWLSSASKGLLLSNIKESRDRNRLMIRLSLSMAVINRFLRMSQSKNSLQLDLSSQRIIHWHAQYIQHAISVADELLHDASEILSQYSQLGGTQFAQNSEIEIECVACCGSVQIKFQGPDDSDECVGVCRKAGHVWGE